MKVKLNEKIKTPPSIKTAYYSFKRFFFSAPILPKNSKIPPLDEKILNDLISCEINFLRLMDRFQKPIRRKIVKTYEPTYLNYNFRKLYYLRQVRYWNYILDDKQVNHAIFTGIPHDIFTYIIFHLCKLKNIPTTVLSQTIIQDTYIFFDNFEEPNIQLKNTINQLRINLKKIPISEIQLSGRFKEYFNKNIDKSQDTTPFYMKKFFRDKFKKKNPITHRFKELFQQNKTLIFQVFYLTYKLRIKPMDLKILLKNLKLNFKKLFKDIKNQIIDQKLFHYYESLTVDPDFTKKFIYVPLHYQPELTTSPLAGVFVDQHLVIELISYFLPEDFYIYIKEHPTQTSLCRSEKYYANLLTSSKIQLISRDIDPYLLIDNCIAVATCTGTAILEALFREKPVLLFGSVFYQYIEGVFKIKTLEDCQRALNQIIKQNFKPKLKDIKIFLNALELNSFEGYINENWKEVSNVKLHKNVENMSRALIEKIKSLNDM